MKKENLIQSLIPKTSTCMKEGLNNFQSQNTKTECSILDLTVLVIITLLQEGKFFVEI